MNSAFEAAYEGRTGGVFSFGGINVATGKSAISTSASAKDAGEGNNETWLVIGALAVVGGVAWYLTRKS